MNFDDRSKPERPGIPIKPADSSIDLPSNTPKMVTPIDSTNWDELEDRLIRVLNYKYLEVDANSMSSKANTSASSKANTSYSSKSRASSKGKKKKKKVKVRKKEATIESVVYTEYSEKSIVSDTSHVDFVFDLIMSLLPTAQTAEHVFLSEPKDCVRFLKFLRDAFTFRRCRSDRT